MRVYVCVCMCMCVYVCVRIHVLLLYTHSLTYSLMQYELTEHIKSGGYGAVYSGRNTQDGTPIAAKLELQGGSDGVSVLAHEYEMMMKVQGIGELCACVSE